MTVGYTPAKPEINQGISFEPPTRTYTVEKVEPVQNQIAKVVAQKPTPPIRIIKDVVKVVANDDLTETDSQIEVADNNPIEISSTVAAPTISETPDNVMNVNTVEFVPVFPGCENLASNLEKIECMSSKIGSFISKKFRSDKFDGLKTNETHKIYVQFKIDKFGDIVDVTARAASKQLEDEGIRVVENLPKMTPGRMGNQPVIVSYLVPISFKVE